MTIVAHVAADARRVRISPRIVVTIALVVVVLGVLWAFAPSFFKLNNLVNILVQASTLAVLAIGMSVVMIGGGIDLSLPFNAALSAVLGAMYMRATGDAVGGPLIMIVAALCIGTFNGAAVGYLGMIPFVVTLAMMTIANGAAVWLTGSISISNIPKVFVDPFFARYFGVPLAVFIASVASVLAIILMSRTVYGRSKHAVTAFVHGLRRQLIVDNIRVGSLAPGTVLNELWGFTDAAEIDRKVQKHEGLRSEDVADAAVFMLSRPHHVTIRDLVILPQGLDL